MIDIGGKEMVLAKHKEGDTALHYACNKDVQIETVFKLIETGGRDLVMERNIIGMTALHCLCSGNAPIEAVSKFIEIGGQELVLAKDNTSGENALHSIFRHLAEDAPVAIVSMLAETGGRNLIRERNRCAWTVLHSACAVNAPTETILKLIKIGGQDLVMQKDNLGKTSLHFATYSDKPRIETVCKLIYVGGHDLVLEKDDEGLGAIHRYFYRTYHLNKRPQFDKIFVYLIQQGILAEYGGEFGIGGLFVENDVVQRRIYNRWAELADFLEIAMQSLYQEQHPPILHAAIIAEAPHSVISIIIERFSFYGCILTRDSLNCLPINIAVKYDLEWNEGMQDVIEATAAALQQPPIYAAAQFGVKWSDDMRELAESEVDEVILGCDDVTGLCLFMLAAMGEYSDLNTIYSLLKMSPGRIQHLSMESRNTNCRKRKKGEE